MAGREHEITFHGNSGRVVFRANPPLEVLETVIRSPTTHLELRGELLSYQRHVKSESDLVNSINALQYLLPALLNLRFPEPPYTESIGGTVGGIEFRWIHRQVNTPFTTGSAEGLQNDVVEAIERIGIANDVSDRRLMASMHYFYVASRLLAAGVSKWEFMPECVLNMCKSLEVLFGESRDEVRNQLKALGYSNEEIEGDFVPLLLLRNHYDVGHPRLAVPKQSQLDVLYRYLERSELKFKDLFNHVIERVQIGQYRIRSTGKMRLDRGEQRRFTELIDSMENRLSPSDSEPSHRTSGQSSSLEG